jgi:hypothetical protein
MIPRPARMYSATRVISAGSSRTESHRLKCTVTQFMEAVR